MRFELSFSTMPCLQIYKADIDICRFLKGIIINNYMGTEDYKITKETGAFLQGYDEKDGWVLIEFWIDNKGQKFIDYANQKWEKYNA